MMKKMRPTVLTAEKWNCKFFAYCVLPCAFLHLSEPRFSGLKDFQDVPNVNGNYLTKKGADKITNPFALRNSHKALLAVTYRTMIINRIESFGFLPFTFCLPHSAFKFLD
jgi:hypothetical protein